MSETLLERLVKIHQDKKRIEVYCPEVGESVFVKPMTIGDRKRISAKAPDGDGYDYMIATVIEKAEDEAGNRLFNLDAKDTLKWNVPESFVRRILAALSEESGTVENQKKD